MKKILSIALVLAVLTSCMAFLPLAAGAGQQGAAPLSTTNLLAPASAAVSASKGLYLHIGSPIAMSDGKILPIDSDNPGFTPILYKTRTLVPLRFVSEFFNADVSYDSQAQTGIVKAGGKTAEFPVGRNYYILDGKQIALDVETLNTGGHIMLPLRVLCEQVLGLSVDYLKGVIVIGETASLDDDTANEIKSKIGAYVKVNDLDTLTEYFAQSEFVSYYVDDFMFEDAIPPAESISPGAGSGSSSGSRGDADESIAVPMPSLMPSEAPESELNMSAQENTDGYSSTNIQVAGVDEGDIIKTDGRYIYLTCYDSIRIIDTAGKMSLAAKIDISGKNLSDIYIDEGRLIAVGVEYARTSRARSEIAGFAYSTWINSVFVDVYDTSDMSDIKLFRSFEIEGALMTTRKQDGYLYLLSSQYAWNSYIDIDNPRPYAGENGVLTPLPLDSIMIAPGCPVSGYVTLSAINLFDAGEKVASEAITVDGYDSTQYMSNSAIYFASQDYISGGRSNLIITRFSINGGKIGYAGSGLARGSVDDQFSMDEYQGHLRVATTEGGITNKNNLFILDENMEICGSVEGFAPGERIYSARFMGGRGYIVTFRQTDPLFVFDLNDPTNPKITGELKVPGFSTYLHPVSENVILGVGRDVYDIYVRDKNGEEVVIGQNTGGIKLSLFDVSDMGKPREIDTLILGDGGYSELLYNHKAAMFKADESILAFCANITDSIKGSEWWDGALVISYANNKISELGKIDSDVGRGLISYGYTFSGQRLVYIGNTLYYADYSVLRSFDLGTLKEIQSFRLG